MVTGTTDEHGRFAVMVLPVVALFYVVEVLLGSSRSVHASELGETSGSEGRTKLSNAEFLGRVVPLFFSATGLVTIMYSPFQSFLLLAASAVLLIWHYCKVRTC